MTSVSTSVVTLAPLVCEDLTKNPTKNPTTIGRLNPKQHAISNRTETKLCSKEPQENKKTLGNWLCYRKVVVFLYLFFYSFFYEATNSLRSPSTKHVLKRAHSNSTQQSSGGLEGLSVGAPKTTQCRDLIRRSN